MIVLIPEEDTGGSWIQGSIHAWAAAWRDLREDIHTLEDGKPVEAGQCDVPGRFPMWRRARRATAPGLFLSYPIGAAAEILVASIALVVH
jgi:hypothetical protein